MQEAMFEVNQTSKTHYHLFRLRGMLDHYDQTGVFDLTVDEPWYNTLMLDYKLNYKSEHAKTYIEKIQNQLQYLERYRNEMTHNELG